MRFSIPPASKFAFSAALTIALLLSAGSFSPANAATFTVNIAADDNTNNGNCSLREAIRSAITHTSVDACPTGTGNDLITFSVGLVTVNSPLPAITSGNIVTIYGGSAKITLNANVPNGTLFTANSGSTLTVQNVNVMGSGQTCFRSTGTLNVINETINACAYTIISTAGLVKVQLATTHMIDTSGGTVGLAITDSTLAGGVPYTLYVGAGGGTVTHTTFGVGQIHISTTGPLTVSRSLLNGVGTLGGIVAANTTVNVTNTIIKGTTQTAIDPEAGAQFIITNSTIIGNTYGLNGTSGNISLKNTILSNTNNCYPGAGFTLTDNGGNLQSAAGCGALPIGNPNLNSSFVPQAPSPAIDGGLNAGCPSNDYYGTARPVDGDGNGTTICDIGAVEKP